ncbi:hypothetical protein B0H14DRAFT_2583136 [Mycena olivaceomarginata]|nr:hypothetical protein B0H14DRAFT_2583136 [Mycena olivaceomarginata]
MSLPFLDTLTGLRADLASRCLLVGTWASSLLYMFEISQIWYYFQSFKQDDWKFKTLVTTALVVDTLGMVGDYICVYLYTITHAGNCQNGLSPLMAQRMLAGDAEYLVSMHWPSLYPSMFSTPVCLLLWFKLFLFSDIGVFSSSPVNSSTRNTLIAPFLCFGIIISFSGALTGSLMGTLYTSLADRPKFKIPMTLWMVSELAVDAGIASVLLWEFRKARGILTETRRALDRLTTITIQSGAAAATIAGAALIAYYIKPESNGGLETLLIISQLSNLNIRKSAKSFSTTTGTSPGPRTTCGEREPPTFTCWATDDSCGIHIHQQSRRTANVV